MSMSDCDGTGNIVRSIDTTSKKEYNYEYEEGRIVRATEADIDLSGEIVTSKVIFTLLTLRQTKKEHRKVVFFALWASNGSSVNDLPAAGHSDLPRASRREETPFFPQKMPHAVCGFFVVFYLLNCAKTH